MKWLVATPALIAAFVVGALTPALRAAPTSAAFLPAVVAQQEIVTSSCPNAPIWASDTGLLSADYRDGVYKIAFQDRAGGSLIRVMRHIGTHLENEPIQPAGRSPVAPAFVPGDRKGGAMALTLSGPKQRIYFTQRAAGETTGPYGIWCIEW